MTVSFRDSVFGASLGVFIGDALGMPVETMEYEQIQMMHGLIKDYKRPDGHKWYGGWPAGHWTDDGQLTMATMESLMACDGFDMHDIARRHIVAMGESDIGWGGSTRNAVVDLSNGKHWSQTGSVKGAGNGVIMKMMPLVAYFMTLSYSDEIVENLNQYTSMTHDNELSRDAAFIHAQVLMQCFRKQITRYALSRIAAHCNSVSRISKNAQFYQEIADILSREYDEMSDKELVNRFRGGTCYVANSLPFSYAFFFRDPVNVETLYRVASAGGDTDSNASIVGSMLGALHGAGFFSPHLIDGLWQKERVLKVVDDFAAWIVARVE